MSWYSVDTQEEEIFSPGDEAHPSPLTPGLVVLLRNAGPEGFQLSKGVEIHLHLHT